jgi:D-xylose 1-dehydrogenase (NADP+, D-xylono-1,5-lactone-forming)
MGEGESVMERKLRWGILGCANIAVKSVIPGIQQSQYNEVVAIASRDMVKSQQTAAMLHIPQAYGSYEELLADPSIDAVYIPLPNHLHKEWTIQAARHGKHVLCEKPIALDSESAAAMAAECEKAHVQLVEAYMYAHHPRYSLLKEYIRDGAIGELRAIHGEFTFNNASDLNNVRYRRDWGGGSIYDVGCYPIHAARLLLGMEPEAATVHAYFSPEHDDVDMMASGLIEFPGSIGLTFQCGMWASGKDTLVMIGTEGRIEVPAAFVPKSAADSSFYIVKGNERTEIQAPHVNQYAIQADDFAGMILRGEASKLRSDDSVRNMRVIDACLQSARSKQRVII